MRWNANQLAERKARQFAVLAHAPDFLGAATPTVGKGLRAEGASGVTHARSFRSRSWRSFQNSASSRDIG
jgi:hypothetical protein